MTYIHIICYVEPALRYSEWMYPVFNFNTLRHRRLRSYKLLTITHA